MSKIVGIDLGTFTSLAATCDKAGQPEVIQNPRGEFCTPSAVHRCPETERILVGRDALECCPQFSNALTATIRKLDHVEKNRPFELAFDELLT